MKIVGSYLCPCGCGYNFITGKKHQDITSEKYFPKFKWSEKIIKIPDSLKNKRLGVFQIGYRIWAKKTKLMIQKFEEAELKK